MNEICFSLCLSSHLLIITYYGSASSICGVKHRNSAENRTEENKIGWQEKRKISTGYSGKGKKERASSPGRFSQLSDKGRELEETLRAAATACSGLLRAGTALGGQMPGGEAPMLNGRASPASARPLPDVCTRV